MNKIKIIALIIIAIIGVVATTKTSRAFQDPQLITVNKPSGTVKTLCSSSCTFSSLSAANGNVGSGNTLKIKPGTYSTTQWDESNVVIQAEEGHTQPVYITGSEMRIKGANVIFDGLSQSSPKLVFTGIQSDLAGIRAEGDHITFYRCGFTDYSSTNMYAQGDYLKVYNCRFYDALYYAIYFKNGYQSEFRNNIFENIGGVAIQTNPHDGGE